MENKMSIKQRGCENSFWVISEKLDFYQKNRVTKWKSEILLNQRGGSYKLLNFFFFGCSFNKPLGMWQYSIIPIIN